MRLYMLMLLLPLILMNLIRNLKWLAPFSMIANILMAVGIGITFYYIFSDVPPITNQKYFSSFQQLPLFFGTAIFALEGIGVVSFILIFSNHASFICLMAAFIELTEIFILFNLMHEGKALNIILLKSPRNG